MKDHVLLPVAVHLWLNREGWAFHNHLNSDEVMQALSSVIRNSKTQLLIRIPFRQGVLVGEKTPDPESCNQRAAGRNPWILRVAYIEASSLSDDRIRAALRKLPRPAKLGPSPELAIAIPVSQPKRTELPRPAHCEVNSSQPLPQAGPSETLPVLIILSEIRRLLRTLIASLPLIPVAALFLASGSDPVRVWSVAAAASGLLLLRALQRPISDSLPSRP